MTDLDAMPAADESAYVYCPRCRSPQAVRPATTFRPGDESLNDLFRGEINCVVCTECRARFRIDVPLLFRDDESLTLIYFIPLDDPGAWEEAEAQMRDLTEPILAELADAVGTPVCRLTVARNSFIEKITLHLHDFDDRIVEYIKYQLYHNPDRGRRIDPVRFELRYDFSAGDSEKLPFLVLDRESGRPAGAVHVPMELYRELAETFGTRSFAHELDALFPGSLVSVERLL